MLLAPLRFLFKFYCRFRDPLAAVLPVLDTYLAYGAKKPKMGYMICPHCRKVAIMDVTFFVPAPTTTMLVRCPICKKGQRLRLELSGSRLAALLKIRSEQGRSS